MPPLTLNGWLRYDLIRRTLRRLPVASVLEVGAGQGALGARLARRYRYVGLEPDPESFATARNRLQVVGRGEILPGDTSLLPPDALFDLVCAFEVLEHIQDDLAALIDWQRRVRPGGWVMLTVPAFNERFGPHDELAGHFRRYEPEQLRALLREAGFRDVVVRTYGFPLGPILEAGRHLLPAGDKLGQSLEERTASSGRWMQPSPLLGLLYMVAAAPFTVIQRPFRQTRKSTALFALAKKG